MSTEIESTYTNLINTINTKRRKSQLHNHMLSNGNINQTIDSLLQNIECCWQVSQTTFLRFHYQSQVEAEKYLLDILSKLSKYLENPLDSDNNKALAKLSNTIPGNSDVKWYKIKNGSIDLAMLVVGVALGCFAPHVGLAIGIAILVLFVSGLMIQHRNHTAGHIASFFAPMKEQISDITGISTDNKSYVCSEEEGYAF